MATIKYDFYCGEDKYSDGDIEEYLRYLVENHIDISTLDSHERTYPVFYHLSHLRENIINWYPIQKDQDVLEIGAGCGAITGALCRKAGNVVSVDLSKRRAEINYQRHLDAENLTIYVGNQNDIQFDRKFDYVVLNGVFEYAMSFTEGEDPYGDFLNKCKSFLKPDGKLLIAIENRIGLKYFTGSAEDHTGNYFLGPNGYPDNRTVRTFSKSEWVSLLKRCGLQCKFYYPYPDYKFPTEIFTDASLGVNGYGKPYYNLESNRYLWLQENELARTFAKEGVAGSFANSFFLEISANDNFANVDYCKLSCDRKPDCRIITSIFHNENGRYVEKQAACPEATGHIEAIYRNSVTSQDGDICCLPGRLSENAVSFDYVTQTTLKNKLLQLLNQQDLEGFKSEVIKFFKTCFADLETGTFASSKEFRSVFGPVELPGTEEAVCGGNIDLIFDNVYCVEARYMVIDPEWVFDFAIPKAFVMWRAVSDFYSHHPEVEKQIGKAALLELLGISPAYEEVFCRWNAHFVYQWMKANSVEAYVKPMHVTSMDYMVSLLRAETSICCNLYYDCGTGYTEEQKLTAEVPLTENQFAVTFDLSKMHNLKSLRFDPIEGMAIRCYVSSEHAKLIPVNALAKEDMLDVFATEDPIYNVVLEELPANGHLHISGYLYPMDYKTKAELCTQVYRQSAQQQLEVQVKMQNALQQVLEYNADLHKKVEQLQQQCQQQSARMGELENVIRWHNKTIWRKIGAYLKKLLR